MDERKTLDTITSFFAAVPQLKKQLSALSKQIQDSDVMNIINGIKGDLTRVGEELTSLRNDVDHLGSYTTEALNGVITRINKDIESIRGVVGESQEAFIKKLEEYITQGCKHIIAFYHDDNRVLKERIERIRKALYVVYKVIEPDGGADLPTVISDALFGTINGRRSEETIDEDYEKIKKGKKKKSKKSKGYDAEMLDVLKRAYLDLEARVAKLEGTQ